MDVIENQLIAMKREIKNKEKHDTVTIKGKFNIVRKDPYDWITLKFRPDDQSEWQPWLDQEEVFETSNGQILYQVKPKLFQYKGMWSDTEILKSSSQEDFQFARFKNCVDVLRNRASWSWLVKLILDSTANGGSKEVIDSKIVPKIEVQSLNAFIGCPGSGKSTFLATFINEMVQKYKILYVGTAHNNVNSFAQKLSKLGLDKDVRILSEESRLIQENRKFHNSNASDFNPKHKNKILDSAKITLSTVNKPIKSPAESKIQILLVDECTRVSILEILTLVYRLKDLKCMIIAGDPRQLGARIGKHDCIDAMRHIIANAKCNKWTLNRQYRFGDQICRPLSQMYYQDQMKVAGSHMSTLRWIVVYNCCCKDEEKIGCMVEAESTLGIYRTSSILDKVIISPYKSQLEKMERLRQGSEIINLKTTDSVQGDEFDHVIFTLGRHEGRGFINSNRINVSMSRARQLLHVIINVKVLGLFKEIAGQVETAEKMGHVTRINYKK